MRRMKQSMPRRHWNLLGIAMLLGLLGCLMGSPVTSEAAKASKDSFRVAVVDPQEVMEKSKAGSRELATLNEHFKARENVLKSDQKELERLQEELKAADGKIPEKELKEKQEIFARKYQDFQKRGQEFQNEMVEKQRAIGQEFQKKIEAVISVVAKRHGFSLVVDKGSEKTIKIILYNRRGLNITGEVIKEFDRRYK